MTMQTEKLHSKTIFRVRHDRDNPYVMLNKQALFDSNLSLKAKGLWAFCLARPDDWTFCITEMLSHTREGERALYSALKELIANGYAYRFKWQEQQLISEEKRWCFAGIEYIFFESKISPEKIEQMKEEFKKSFPHRRFVDLQNEGLQNAALLKKEEEVSIEETNKKDATPSGDAPASSFSSSSQKTKTPSSLSTSPLIERASNHPCLQEFKKIFNTHLVGISDQDHLSLVAKYGEQLIEQAYQHLAEWKLSKAAADPKMVKKHSDYYRITHWVIKQIKESGQQGMLGGNRSKRAIAIDYKFEEKSEMAYAIGTLGEEKEEEIRRFLERKTGQPNTVFTLGKLTYGKIDELLEEMQQELSEENRGKE
jgi:hypothetical protein